MTKGLLLIFYALIKNKSLKILKCNDTVIYTELLLALSKMLKHNNTLEELWLLDTDIDKYVRGLSHNHSPSYTYLDDLMEKSKFRSYNKTFKSLLFGDSPDLDHFLQARSTS
jgi:hypothetical protein